MTEERPQSMIEFLYQDEWWQDRNGQWWDPRRMDLAYATNLRAYLLRHAPSAHLAALSSMLGFQNTLNGEAAIDSMEMEIARHEDTEPMEWMLSTPLVQALDQRIAHLSR